MKKTAREILKEVLVKYYDPTNDSIIGEGVYSLDQAADKILSDLSELVMGGEVLKPEGEANNPYSYGVFRGYNSALKDISKLFATDKEGI